MKSIIQTLLFDQELVHHLNQVKVSKDQLYNQLISGKITLEEYLLATKP